MKNIFTPRDRESIATTSPTISFPPPIDLALLYSDAIRDLARARSVAEFLSPASAWHIFSERHQRLGSAFSSPHDVLAALDGAVQELKAIGRLEWLPPHFHFAGQEKAASDLSRECGLPAAFVPEFSFLLPLHRSLFFAFRVDERLSLCTVLTSDMVRRDRMFWMPKLVQSWAPLFNGDECDRQGLAARLLLARLQPDLEVPAL